jgi:hypothetical protein
MLVIRHTPPDSLMFLLLLVLMSCHHPLLTNRSMIDEQKALGSRFGVSGYPTLKWFPRGNSEGEAYNGGRSPKDFVEFVNEKSGTERLVGGGFLDTVIISLLYFTCITYTHSSINMSCIVIGWSYLRIRYISR